MSSDVNRFPSPASQTSFSQAGTVLPKVRLDPVTSLHLARLLSIKAMPVQVTGDLLIHQPYFWLFGPTKIPATPLSHNFITPLQVPTQAKCSFMPLLPSSEDFRSYLGPITALLTGCGSCPCLLLILSVTFILPVSGPLFPSLFFSLLLMPSRPTPLTVCLDPCYHPGLGCTHGGWPSSGTLHKHTPFTSLSTCRTPEYAPFETYFFGVS